MRKVRNFFLRAYLKAAFLNLIAKKEKGQTTVEYLLMMVSVAAAALILVILFYRKLLGAVFTIIGLVIGAGVPQK